MTETITTSQKTVACAGNGALGHPKVYLNMGKDNQVTCPYCSRTFVYKADKSSASAGH